nr:dATP/dGTP pyrophosphohydrolase domain-containing protein [Escherichia coli]
MASLEREQIRHEHAKWSDSTFGCVGPIGPLKHLSKEALEAAAEPDDLSEWADMQFLLWDAQRRAGISDAEITAAMEDKLKINMERQWPEPKDGEPRLHIKEPGNYPSFGFAENTDDLFVGKTLLHGDVLMWLMKTLLTSGCTNQRGAGHRIFPPPVKDGREYLFHESAVKVDLNRPVTGSLLKRIRNGKKAKS